MIITVNGNSKIPIFKQLSDNIKMMIASGELKQGEQLPSIRELAVSLSLNPNTIVKSYKELEMEGFLETKKGVGVFVKSNLDKKTVNNLKEQILKSKVNELIKTAKNLHIEKEKIIEEINKIYKEEL